MYRRNNMQNKIICIISGSESHIPRLQDFWPELKVQRTGRMDPQWRHILVLLLHYPERQFSPRQWPASGAIFAIIYLLLGKLDWLQYLHHCMEIMKHHPWLGNKKALHVPVFLLLLRCSLATAKQHFESRSLFSDRQTQTTRTKKPSEVLVQARAPRATLKSKTATSSTDYSWATG